MVIVPRFVRGQKLLNPGQIRDFGPELLWSKNSEIRSMRVSRSYIAMVLVWSLIGTSIFGGFGAQGIPCSILLRLETMKDFGLKVVQGARPSRLPFVGRYKANFDISKMNEVLSSLTDTKARENWINDFLIRGEKGQTESYESVVYTALISPTKGREALEMLNEEHLVLTRKKLMLDRKGLLLKIKKMFTQNVQPVYDEKELEYLNEWKIESQRLFLNKVTAPERITDVNRHIVSLYKMILQLSSRQGDPFVAIGKLAKTWMDVHLQNQIIDDIYQRNYINGKIPENTGFRKSALEAGFNEFKKVIFQYDLTQKKNLIEFINEVNDPELVTLLAKEITPADNKAMAMGGEPALLAQLVKEKGVRGGVAQFWRITIGSMAVKACLFGAVASLMGYYFWKQNQEDQGMINSSNTAKVKASPEPPAYIDEEKRDIAFAKFMNESINPFAIVGLFDEKADPENPGGPATSPCDPTHSLRDKIGEARKNQGFTDNVYFLSHTEEFSDKNPELSTEVWVQMKKMTQGDPNSACSLRFVDAYLRTM